MIWVLLDVLLGLLALVALTLCGVSLFRHARTLRRTVGATAAALSEAMPDTRR